MGCEAHRIRHWLWGARRSVLLVAMAVGAAVGARAADGRIPIATVPYTITASGSYYLTADLTYAAASPAITIAASNVSLDLNGHTLWEQSSALNAVTINAQGMTNLRISNGMLKGGSSAIYLGGVPGGVISVEGLTITGVAGYGIFVSGGSPQPAVYLSSNRISAVGGPTTNPTGIGVFSVTGGAISGNQIVGNGTAGGDGIFLDPATGLTIEDNTVSGSYVGITAQPGTTVKVLRNTISQPAYGLYFYNSSGIEVAQNLVVGCSQTGLYFYSVTNCLYRDNTVEGNATNYNIPGTGVTNGGGNY